MTVSFLTVSHRGSTPLFVRQHLFTVDNTASGMPCANSWTNSVLFGRPLFQYRKRYALRKSGEFIAPSSSSEFQYRKRYALRKFSVRYLVWVFMRGFNTASGMPCANEYHSITKVFAQRFNTASGMPCANVLLSSGLKSTTLRFNTASGMPCANNVSGLWYR